MRGADFVFICRDDRPRSSVVWDSFHASGQGRPLLQLRYEVRCVFVEQRAESSRPTGQRFHKVKVGAMRFRAFSCGFVVECP